MPVGSYSYRNVDYERDLKKDQEPVSVYQDIDPVILRLLGLTDVFDLDYSTYKTLLKEAMVKGRMPKTEIPNEEVELLTNEWRKVKSSTGRFKIKKKTVKVSPLFSKPESIAGSKIDPVKMLPGSVQDPVEKSREDKKERKERESEESIFNSIFNSLNNIYTTLKSAFKSDKKNAADAADEKELKRRQGKESFMEGFKKFVANTAKKTLQPAVNILKKILDGIKLVLLGWVLNNLIDWLGDEKNRENVDAVTEFLSKNFLKLIALWAAISLAGGVGVLVKLGGTILAGVTKLMWSLGKALVAAGIRNPLTALAIGGTVAIGTGAVLASQRQQKDREETNKRADDQVVTPKEFVETGETPGYSQLLGELGTFPGGMPFNEGGLVIDPELQSLEDLLRLGLGGGGGGTNSLTEQAKVKTFGSALGDFFSGDDGKSRAMTDLEKSQRMATGGQVPGTGNKDTVPSMLTPGEFVMSKGAVQKYGVSTLEGMNAAGGGTNQPIQMEEGGPVYAAGGGIIDGAKKIIGRERGQRNGCARTTRAALRVGGNTFWNRTTQKGDLDTPKGGPYTKNLQAAASFGGSDMGKVITNRSQIEAGDIILWRADYHKGGDINKGAITHVGIAADKGLKHQYDHNWKKGWQYRNHWARAAGTSWFAGIRLGESGGSLPPPVSGAEKFTADIGSGDARTLGTDLADSLTANVPAGVFGKLLNIISGGAMGSTGPDDVNQQASTNHVQIPKPVDSSNVSIVATRSIYQLVG